MITGPSDMRRSARKEDQAVTRAGMVRMSRYDLVPPRSLWFLDRAPRWCARDDRRAHRQAGITIQMADLHAGCGSI